MRISMIMIAVSVFFGFVINGRGYPVSWYQEWERTIRGGTTGGGEVFGCVHRGASPGGYEALLITRDCRRFSARGLNDMISRTCQRARIKVVSAHVLRHTMITLACAAGRTSRSYNDRLAIPAPLSPKGCTRMLRRIPRCCARLSMQRRR